MIFHPGNQRHMDFRNTSQKGENNQHGIGMEGD
jgi:hypothetical protein